VLSSATHAVDKLVDQKETFTGGVFARETLPKGALPDPVIVPPAKSKNAAWSQPVAIDTKGKTADVVVTLNSASNELRSRVASAANVDANVNRAQLEATFVDIVDNSQNYASERALTQALGGALAARSLFDVSRIAADERVEGATKDPRELLERYIILRYPTTDVAAKAVETLTASRMFDTVAQDFTMRFSAAPSDPYFARSPSTEPDAQYQWGLQAMNFASAWDRTRGGGYVGVIDAAMWPRGAYDGSYGDYQGVNPVNFTTNVPDLEGNFRKQFSYAIGNSFPGNGASTFEPHARHITGIIAAKSSLSAHAASSSGMSGGCPNCSIAFGAKGPPSFGDALAAGAFPITSSALMLAQIVDRGAQVVNISSNVAGSSPSQPSCPNSSLAFCTALDYAVTRDVLVVVSSGNYYSGTSTPDPLSTKDFPTFPATASSVLPVAAIELTNATAAPTTSGNWKRLDYDTLTGTGIFASHGVDFYGVSAPGRNIVSTFKANDNYVPDIKCGDVANVDLSGVVGDGVGTCSGTSMAAPFVTSLAMLLRTSKPMAGYTQVRDWIRNSGHLSGGLQQILGYGVPNARTALDSATSATNGQTRLTPLFSMYSSARLDHFYTTVPQMGTAAYGGVLYPRGSNTTSTASYSGVGTGVPNYPSFPNIPSFNLARAEAWVFSTPENPKSATPLSPLFRLSFACNHPLYVAAQPTVCASTPAHIDTVYTTDAAGINAFVGVGYLLDGLEGYIYPKSQPQPVGTVRLIRKYNSARDDHAIFPETLLTQYTNAGYTLNSGSDWLGYVYPNSGTVPTIQ
jgi:serine protease